MSRRLGRMSEQPTGPSYSPDYKIKASDLIKAGEEAEMLMGIRREPRWLPIETAPEDEWVLIGWTGKEELDIAKHRTHGWTSGSGFHPEDPQPTHWQPLPSPPENKGVGHGAQGDPGTAGSHSLP